MAQANVYMFLVVFIVYFMLVTVYLCILFATVAISLVAFLTRGSAPGGYRRMENEGQQEEVQSGNMEENEVPDIVVSESVDSTKETEKGKKRKSGISSVRKKLAERQLVAEDFAHIDSPVEKVDLLAQITESFNSENNSGDDLQSDSEKLQEFLKGIRIEKYHAELVDRGVEYCRLGEVKEDEIADIILNRIHLKRFFRNVEKLKTTAEEEQLNISNPERKSVRVPITEVIHSFIVIFNSTSVVLEYIPRDIANIELIRRCLVEVGLKEERPEQYLLKMTNVKGGGRNSLTTRGEKNLIISCESPEFTLNDFLIEEDESSTDRLSATLELIK